ncbi:lipopolysaccharide biosynthesis protein [Collinsella intestinalis]|uniref:lipopolysaccharide biosynthesis protein n=1 Tax=Collinsella intestinalis TaxID=147207 RepID=UPI00195A3625|nr:hypothetical protein [Collinsella intestinalis]MBM6908750.1 hypothetical protein [Collinsella intestinalis]
MRRCSRKLRVDSAALNKTIRLNALGSYAVKGISMLVGLAAVPAYMRYFESGSVLGTWYTIQTMLQWVLMFDLGIGNGLRNELVAALVGGDDAAVSGYVGSSYRLMGAVCIMLAIAVSLLGVLVPWNAVLNIDRGLVSAHSLSVCMTVVGVGVVVQMFLQLVNGVLYALQLSSVVNALGLVSNTLILAFVLVAPSAGDEANLLMLGFANVACMLLPPAAATAVVFRRNLLGVKVQWRSFEWEYARRTLSTGFVILVLQVAWMVVASTHSLLISLFRSPAEVVEYQIYYKVYYTLGSIAAIALVPIWSAVTAAAAQGRYEWVVSTYKRCLLLALAVGAVCVATAPFVQIGFDLWLGNDSIPVNPSYVLVMSLFSVAFVLQNVNASIGNGLSYFKVQLLLMGLAAALMVPFSYALCNIMDSWTGVIAATVFAILPFQIVEPIACIRYLRKLERDNVGKIGKDRL